MDYAQTARPMLYIAIGTLFLAIVATAALIFLVIELRLVTVVTLAPNRLPSFTIEDEK